ncbi:glycosyl hydrolase family 61-domain-containing protein [Mycena rosella]|uniref:lytic cellulose monooxygenase (C4-dehydrogenating) n=1 Tax=Mycena rosella TaxID=1033263 RepID=A0AAD7MAN8_MYCRO|nr:glycosyl hydrolase family 61-domain-containing protein [Mycena rosella]
MRPSTVLLLPFLAIPYVSAHGFVHKVWIGTETFLGNTPNAEPTSSIVRQINNVDPVKGATNPDVNCGNNAQLASNITDANPGDSMAFLWTGGDLSTWPHNIGPMLTYMASCGSTDCTTFDSSTAKWFKIAQVGRIPNDTDGNWFQNLETAGTAANVTLPSNIKPGAYLIRHEIIALHLATVKGGAEFYPSCSQIRVGGSGTGAPTAAELVSLPGAYSDTDPGILVPDVFDTPPPPYTFPGPPIAAFVGASSSSPSSGSGSSSTPTSSAPSSSPTGTPKGKSCKLKRAPTTPSKRAIARPAHMSRIMRDLALSFGGSAH